MKTRFTLTAIAFAVSLLAVPALQAQESRLINNAQGVPFIDARFFEPGDPPFQIDGGAYQSSVDSFTELRKSQIMAGLQQWGHYFNLAPGGSPVVLNIGTITDTNAYAYSALAGTGVALTQVQAVLQNRDPGALELDAHGFIGIGRLNYANDPYIASQLPRAVSGVDLAVVAFHEVGHALGISSSVRENGNGTTIFNPQFANDISQWTAHLRDDNGQAAQPGQVIYCALCVNPAAASYFDLRQDKGYFSGANVDEVLAGAMRGVPVAIMAGAQVDTNYMAHIELKNSLMSHQTYRNYTTFMEAELAVLQDLGYSIDRRNFFGSSVYGNGLTIVNDNGYFQRNADGTAYIPNTYNLATLGLGLHIYGSYNTVFQRADLLSAGAGGAGVRIDGEGNKLVILPGTRVYADGAYGRGVMFAYGKNHSFVQRGDVQALGVQGIAVSFDFGNNAMGNEMDYRGSYIYRGLQAGSTLLPELDGPLVTRFDLTGRLAGSYAAIYISDNAYVGQINVMRGASLQGDILSGYNEVDSGGAQRLTTLSFGYLADAQGRATSAADAAFALRYDGNIVGINNLSLAFQGGTTIINGDHQVYDVAIAHGATLGGTSRYQLNAAGIFTNHGTLAPEGGIGVTGNYVQGSDGTLQAAVDGNSNIGALVVSGSAAIDGALAIAPQRSWYANSFSLTSDQWLQAGSITGGFTSVSAVLASPTLTASAAALGGQTYRINVDRRSAAYSRYADDDTTRQVGLALDTVAGGARSDMRALVAALDFSAADGSGIAPALRQLSPLAYGEMFSGALLRERHIGQLVAATRTPGVSVDERRPLSANDWNAFAMPFGSAYWRDRSGSAAGANGSTYGVVLGVERGIGTDGWTLGLNGAISGQSTRVDGQTSAAGESTALDVGAHLGFAPDPQAGPHAFAQARVGVEDGRLERHIAFNGYRASPQGTWTGAAAMASLGGGWRWQVMEGSSVGPLAGVDYVGLYRPAVTESKADGPGLQLDSNSFRSLRTRLGGEWRSDFTLPSGERLRANLGASWSREMLDRTTTQSARFAGYPDTTFSSRSEVVKRDSVDVQAGASYRVKQNIVLDAALSGTFWRGGDAELTGAVSASWRF